jgi:hypothetical protein
MSYLINIKGIEGVPHVEKNAAAAGINLPISVANYSLQYYATLFNKDLGGDAEAGLSDDGRFTKQTLGLVYRPINTVALKVDSSNHSQKVGGTYKNYVEGRFSYSYIWSL